MPRNGASQQVAPIHGRSWLRTSHMSDGVVGRSAGIGVATAAAALGTAELVAGLYRSAKSPFAQVGNRVIDAAPPWLKTFAIETFGTHDKQALIAGMGVVLVLLAIGLGFTSRNHLPAATAGVAAFGGVGIAATLAGSATIFAALPSVAGALAGAATLRTLARSAWGEPNTDASETAITRRHFLLGALAATALGASAAAGGRALRSRFDASVARARIRLNAARPLPEIDVESVSADGAASFYTSNSEFYRIDTALEVPQVDVSTWVLKISGMVDRPLTFTYEELSSRELIEADVTLTCVSNEVGGQLAGTARWLGIDLNELLSEAGVDPAADQILGRSVDGYSCGFPTAALNDGRTAMVVLGMNGEPLPIVHGFPARLLVAGLYGYVSATKWLSEIELATFAAQQQYWVPRGYSERAPIKTFSRIDTPGGLSQIDAGRHAIAGVAWAQTRGIERVEVRVDDGPWRLAELRAEANTETWRQWVLPHEFTPGSHTITCRATDRTGARQTEERQPPRPDGASGWHSVVVIVA